MKLPTFIIEFEISEKHIQRQTYIKDHQSPTGFISLIEDLVDGVCLNRHESFPTLTEIKEILLINYLNINQGASSKN